MKLRLWFEILDALALTRGYGQLSQSLGEVHHIQQLSPKPTNLHEKAFYRQFGGRNACMRIGNLHTGTKYPLSRWLPGTDMVGKPVCNM